jgi:hypothetical protein
LGVACETPVGHTGNNWLLALAVRIAVVIGQKVKESNDEMDESLYPPWSRTDRQHSGLDPRNNLEISIRTQQPDKTEPVDGKTDIAEREKKKRKKEKKRSNLLLEYTEAIDVISR